MSSGSSCKVNTSVEEKLRTNERSGCSELAKLKQMDANVQYSPELQGYVKVYSYARDIEKKVPNITLQMT